LEIVLCIFFKIETSTTQIVQNQLEKSGINFFYASYWKGNDHLQSYIQGLSKIIKLTKNESFDIIHSHFQLGSISAILLKQLGLAKVILRTAHNHPEKEWVSNFSGWFRYQLFSKWIFPLFMDIEVGVSQSIVSQINKYPVSYITHKKACLIYNAIPSYYKELMPLPKNNEPIIGSVGRLSKQKGFRYFLEAISLLQWKIPNLKVWIIGDGELREELENLRDRLGLKNSVFFLGKRQDIIDLLHKMNLFVLPSLWEGLPTSVLESMSCGLPVIATNIEGTRELIRDNETGWLVPPADPFALAERIEMALKNPSQCEYVRYQAFKELDRFLIEYVAEDYLKLYQKLLGKCL